MELSQQSEKTDSRRECIKTAREDHPRGFFQLIFFHFYQIQNERNGTSSKLILVHINVTTKQLNGNWQQLHGSEPVLMV